MAPAYYNFERTLAWHCAPALAGIKPADLISWEPQEHGGMELLGHYSAMLTQRGIRLRVLGQRGRRILLLIFRPARLDRWLTQSQVADMLSQVGYPVGAEIDTMLTHLRRRLLESGFPHEIGLFLGYPPADVAGFLENDGKGCKLCGFWKVYGDVDEAARQFAAFRRCRDALSRRVAGGISLAQVFPAA